MRVLIFRHVPFEGAGRLETALRDAGIAFDYADLYRDAAPVRDPAEYGALVFLGGPMSVNDGLEYLRREKKTASGPRCRAACPFSESAWGRS